MTNFGEKVKNVVSTEKIRDKIKKVTSSNDSEGENKKPATLENIICTAIRIPGIKVDREAFLKEQFESTSPELLQIIIEKGPIEAKIPRSELQKIASKRINKSTLISTTASFAAGLPGGFAMAATIPLDMLQFYAVALALGQEIAYLYGEEDLWSGGMPDIEKVKNQLLVYCGVMLGATGASQAVRVFSSALAKQALKKIPQKALTKTFYYPIIKSIAKACGAKMTKEVFAKGVAKAVPIVGGVVAGGLTFVTLRPMGKRLANAFDEAHFSYSQKEFEDDWRDIVEVCEKEEGSTQPTDLGIITEKSISQSSSDLDKIQKAKQMLDEGIINEEEFSEIKAKTIAKI